MSVPKDLAGSNGLLEDIGIAVYEGMTRPGAPEVRDLCDQLRKRIEEIKELRVTLEQRRAAASEAKTRLNGAMSYLDEALKG